jgi:hypothetical protein
MPVTSRSLPVGTVRQSSKIRSVAYIGTAAILAVFMLSFASTPKARAHADHYCEGKQPGGKCILAQRQRDEGGQVTGYCYSTTAEVRDGHW